MSETHRALAVILLIALAVYWQSGPLGTQALPGAYALRRNLWVALTCAAFVLANFWYFVIIATGLLLWAASRDRNAPALFLALLFVVPDVEQAIPGFGVVNLLFGVSFPRLLSLTLLLPLFVRLMQQAREPRRALERAADLLLAAYLVVQLVLLVREPSLTSAVRSTFYLFVDVFLPYFVFSRSLRDLAKLRDATTALVTAGLLLAVIGMFEAVRHWLLYFALATSWGASGELMYLGRNGALRAMGSTGHSIVLGYVLTICLFLYLPLKGRIRSRWTGSALLLILIGGVLSPLSRGPWVGAAAGLLVYLALGARPIKNLGVLGGVAISLVAVLPLFPFGKFMLGVLPFIGTVETSNIDYRQHLVENAAQLLWLHPMFGSSDFTQRLGEMGMVQGQGLVDVVNTYVQVALGSGLVGLGLFIGFMLTALACALRARKLSKRAGQADVAEVGRSLAAAQVAVIVTIGTVSSIQTIPWIYWSLAGMLVGYTRFAHASAGEPKPTSEHLRFA